MLRTRDKPCARCCHLGHPAQNLERPLWDVRRAAAVAAAQVFRRDKTSLSGRLHRLSEGVLTHRAFRLGLNIARGPRPLSTAAEHRRIQQSHPTSGGIQSWPPDPQTNHLRLSGATRCPTGSRARALNAATASKPSGQLPPTRPPAWPPSSQSSDQLP